MNGIFLPVFSDIRKKKVQSILLLIVILISTIGFATSAGILSSINSPFEQTFNTLKGPHVTLAMDSKINNVTGIKNWWDKQNGIESVTDLMKCVIASGPLVNGKKLNTDFYLSETTGSMNKINKLQVVEGTKDDKPGVGEIWLPTGVAYSNDVKVGDKISIDIPGGKKESFKVSAIVVDPIFSTQMMNPVRVWLAPGTLQKIFPEEALTNYLMGIRFLDKNDESKYLSKFEDFLGAPFSGFIYDYETVKMSFTFLYQIIGMILLIFAVILILVTLYILYSIISDSVVSDYRTIGILKSTGFTPGNIISIYMLKTLLVAVVSIPVGIFVSSFAIKKLTDNLMKILGVSNSNVSLISLFLVVFIIMMAVIALSAFLSAKKAGRVKPAEAIRFGEPPEKYKKKKSGARISKRLPLSISMGVNQLLAYKRQILFSFIIFAVTAFVAVFGINSYESIKQMANDRTSFGFDSSDLTIVSGGKNYGIDNSELVSWLKADKMVEKVLPSRYITTGVIPKDSKNPSMSIIGNCFDGDMSLMDLKTIEGRNPARDDEIAIATNTSTKYNKKIGDRFDLYLEGKLLQFKVSGIYQGINNMGQGYRITYGAMKRANPEYELSDMLVKLKNPDDSKSLTDAVSKRFGSNVNVMSTEESFNNVMKPIIDNMGIAIVFVMIIFIAVLAATLASSTILFIHKNKRIFGIYKTVGLTPNQARFSIVSRNLIIALAAGIIGTLLSLYVLSPAMTMICKSMGIVQYPFVVNVLGTVAAVPLMLVLCFVSSWLPSGQAAKVQSRILLNE
ncbi:MAG: FtsX-like permease family protein [Bacillota bacterium]|nr:FtsX-like permease family protein [Bacillota bacterium]